VQPKRQKLLGIKPTAGGLITDETLLSACVPPKCVMMMGYERASCQSARAMRSAALRLPQDARGCH
jgi:hypothetical protein